MKKKITFEKAVEMHILQWLFKNGIFIWKQPTAGYYDSKTKRFRKHVNPFAINGVSDIIGCLPDGRLLAIECKTIKGKVSPHQKKFIDNVNKNNGVAFVARSLEDTINEFTNRNLIVNPKYCGVKQSE